MDSAEEVRAHLHALHEAVWELAAIAVALRDATTTDPAHRQAAERVLVEAGMMIDSAEGPRPGKGLAAAMGDDPSRQAAQAATGILQSAATLSGANGWTQQDDRSLLSQGWASAQMASGFATFAVPMLDGLRELLSAPSPVMLDVGVGVAAMAVAFCQAIPRLSVVGLDVLPRALELARGVIGEAGMADRIELRLQDVADLEDRDRFCLCWLPAPFVPRPALDAGLSRIVGSLVPGGWLVLGHAKLAGPRRSDALTRFQTVAFGGTAIDGELARDLLRRADLENVETLPTPYGAPGLTVGRRTVP